MTLNEEITDLLLYEKLAREVTKKKFPTFQDAIKALQQKYSCKCPHCKGEGEIDLGTYDYYDRTREYAPCYDCNGRGFVTPEEARKIQERYEKFSLESNPINENDPAEVAYKNRYGENVIQKEKASE